MKWHLSKQGNILAVTPESKDVCVEQCVYRRDVVGGRPRKHHRRTDRKLIYQSGSQCEALFIPSTGELVKK